MPGMHASIFFIILPFLVVAAALCHLELLVFLLLIYRTFNIILVVVQACGQVINLIVCACTGERTGSSYHVGKVDRENIQKMKTAGHSFLVYRSRYITSSKAYEILNNRIMHLNTFCGPSPYGSCCCFSCFAFVHGYLMDTLAEILI